MIDEALAKKLRLQGISKHARPAFFQGHRIDRNANFTHHCCWLCGRWEPCEMEQCDHAVCVRILPCCDPNVIERQGKRKAKR